MICNVSWTCVNFLGCQKFRLLLHRRSPLRLLFSVGRRPLCRTQTQLTEASKFWRGEIILETQLKRSSRERGNISRPGEKFGCRRGRGKGEGKLNTYYSYRFGRNYGRIGKMNMNIRKRNARKMKKMRGFCLAPGRFSLNLTKILRCRQEFLCNSEI